MDLFEAIKNRYSVKLFTGEKIPQSDLDKIKESIRLAPSSFNIQPWKVKIVSDKKTLEELQKVSNNQPQIGTASHVLVFCSINDLTKNKDLLLDYAKNKISKEKYEGYKKMLESYFTKLSPEEFNNLRQRDVYLAIENTLLAATALGIGACPVGGFEPEKYIEILKIPKGLTPILVVPIRKS